MVERELDAVHATIEKSSRIAHCEQYAGVIARRVSITTRGDNAQPLDNLLKGLEPEVGIGNGKLGIAALEANNGRRAAVRDPNHVKRYGRTNILRPAAGALTLCAALQHERYTLNSPQYFLPQPEKIIQPHSPGLHTRALQLHREKWILFDHGALLALLGDEDLLPGPTTFAVCNVADFELYSVRYVSSFIDYRTIVRYRILMANDRQYLARLQDYYTQHRVLPSYSRIGALVGLNSKASVAEMVMRLKVERFLESSPDRRLKPGKRFFERPLAESVRAGLPSPAVDSNPEGLSIDEYLVAHPSKTVLITVKGDSMVDAGIHAGDVVVVEKRNSANIGEIVVAIIDNEFTLKRLHKERGRIVLKSENKAYPVIRPKDDLEIFGVVVGQFRKYR